MQQGIRRVSVSTVRKPFNGQVARGLSAVMSEVGGVGKLKIKRPSAETCEKLNRLCEDTSLGDGLSLSAIAIWLSRDDDVSLQEWLLRPESRNTTRQRRNCVHTWNRLVARQTQLDDSVRLEPGLIF